jgi:hypothetical protein
MKKYLLLWIAAGLMCSGLRAEATQKLVVHLVSGESIAVDLNEEPVTTFNEADELVITTTEREISYLFSNVQKYTFESIAEGLEAVSASNLLVRQNGENLEIEGLNDKTIVEVFTMEGKRLTSTQAQASQTTILPLGVYPAGTYIINAGGSSFKFVKQ